MRAISWEPVCAVSSTDWEPMLQKSNVGPAHAIHMLISTMIAYRYAQRDEGRQDQYRTQSRCHGAGRRPNFEAFS
jgi:hypothetical protein